MTTIATTISWPVTIEAILFYGFSILALVSALGVIFSRNPVHAVLSLVVTFIASSGLWLLMQSEFLALILIVVYVGAVMVLFLFVVMMLDVNLAPLKEGLRRHFMWGVAVGVLLIGQIVWVFIAFASRGDIAEVLPNWAHPMSHTKMLGIALYTEHLYPLEIAGVLLLAAIVAAIAISYRGAKNRRGQDPSAQVKVQKADRLKIVKGL